MYSEEASLSNSSEAHPNQGEQAEIHGFRGLLLKYGQESEGRPETCLINLCGSQALDRWVGKIVGQADSWTLVLGVLAKTFSCHHDWDRGFSDKVVGEGAKNDSARR